MTLVQLRQQREYATDKRAYLRLYDELFAPLQDRDFALLELGVLNGGSLQLWRDYFTRARVFGIDDKPAADYGDGICTLEHRITNEPSFRAFCREQFGTERFGVIIDDASHHASLTAAAFNTLFDEFLAPGGLYAIEDWGVGYWRGWSESAGGLDAPARLGTHEGDRYVSHQGGMAGLVKQLVDYLNWYRQTGVARLYFAPGVVVVEKA